MSKIPGSNKGRNRNRNSGGKRPQGRGGNFDQNGGRGRGNAQQLMDKFLSLARDANSQGDRIAAENYFQHADHYYRVVHARNEQQEARRRNSNNGSANNGNSDQGNAPDGNPGQGKPGNDSAQQSADPIPVQQTGGDSGPVDLVKNTETASEQANSEANSPAKESSAQQAKTDDKSISGDEAPPPKKPRRGRPPKKAPAADKEASAPEAAE